MRHPGIVGMSVVGSVLATSAAFAEGGYFSGQNGARAAGRSGAFAARADDLGAMMFNPAGLAHLDGTLIQVSEQLSYNSYTYTRAPTVDYGRGDGTTPTVTFAPVRNGQPLQPVLPLLGAASRLGLTNWTFAVAAFAPSGIGREQYPRDGGQNYMMLEREAIILSYAASAAWRPSDTFGVGATAQWIHVPRLVYSLVIDGTESPQTDNPVSSVLDMRVTTSGSDPMTLNAIVGAWLRPTPAFEVAISGQVLPAKIVARSRLDIEPIRSNLGSLTLKRNGATANDVTVTLPLPLLARLAGRYRHLTGGVELFDLELDLEYETWSRVSTFTVDGNHLRVDYGGDHLFIDRIEIQKHWRDTLTVKLGGDYAALPGRLTLRGGAFYVTPVAPNAYTNIDFPTGATVGGSLGFSLLFGRHFELALAYQLRVQPTVSVSESNGRVYQQVPGSACTPPYTDPETCSSHTLGTPGPVVNAGRYQASSHLVLLDAIIRFGQ